MSTGQPIFTQSGYGATYKLARVRGLFVPTGAVMAWRALAKGLVRLVAFATVITTLLVPGNGTAGDYEDGITAIGRGDHEAAYASFRRAAERGNAFAQSSLAAMYYNGLGAEKDVRQALYWYTQAAEQGHAGAQYNLGLIYAEGEGVARDYEKALYWYGKAAEQGHAEALGRKRKWRITLNKPPQASAAGPGATGTGFYVSRAGHVLTNLHVVQGCSSLALEPIGQPRRTARVVATDSENDFAIIAAGSKPAQFARFRTNAVRQGEGVVVYGFPLSGALASTGNATTGNVTALAGLRDDARVLQISAPVQPGNSGGPLLDLSGAVVGVVVAKLNAAKAMQTLGDIPQNINFALKASLATTFLDAHGIEHESRAVGSPLSVPDVVDMARSVSVRVLCLR